MNTRFRSALPALAPLSATCAQVVGGMPMCASKGAAGNGVNSKDRATRAAPPPG